MGLDQDGPSLGFLTLSKGPQCLATNVTEKTHPEGATGFCFVAAVGTAAQGVAVAPGAAVSLVLLVYVYVLAYTCATVNNSLGPSPGAGGCARSQTGRA